MHDQLLNNLLVIPFCVYCTEYVNDANDWMDMIMEKVFVDPASYRAEILKINIPPELSSEYEHPDKVEIIISYVSRFNQGRVVWSLRIFHGRPEIPGVQFL